MRKEPNNIIYHYTSLDALINGIIVTNPKQYEEICLWASHSDYMNDKSEIKFSSELIDNKIKEFCNGKFYQTYMELKNISDDKEIHILSFSKSLDSLPMWNMYGKQGKGIMLGFNFSSDNLELECNYIDKKELNSFLDSIINKLLLYDNNNNEPNFEQIKVLVELYNQRFAIKSKYFEYEKEIRMIIDPNKTLEQIFNDSNPHSQVNFRIIDNMLTPYFKFYFQKETLIELWIGPTQNTTLSYNSLRKYLDKNGFNHTEIKNSDCPLRT